MTLTNSINKILKILGCVFFIAVWSIGVYYIFTLDYSRINEPIQDFFKENLTIIWIVWSVIGYLGSIFVRKSGHMFIGPVSFILYPHLPILIIYLSLHNHWSIVLLTIVVISIGMKILRKLEIKYSKKIRDTQADKILRRIQSKSQNISPYCLYLRSFFTTNALMAQYEHREYYGNISAIDVPELNKPSEPVDLEIVLSEAVRHIEPLIALGEPGEMHGAGRIFSSEAEWEENVIRLMNNATLIIVIPSNRECILKEIRFLKAYDNMEKTVWIMPQEAQYKSIRTLTSHVEYFDCKDEWKKAREALVSMKITLPLYDDSGEIFRIDNFGRSYGAHPLSLSHTFFISPKIKECLAEYGFGEKTVHTMRVES